MSWNSRRNSKFTNIILVIICIALIVVLGGLLLTNRKEMKQESERLQKLSEKQETGIDNYETVKEHASELKEEAGEEDRVISSTMDNLPGVAASKPSRIISDVLSTFFPYPRSAL